MGTPIHPPGDDAGCRPQEASCEGALCFGSAGLGAFSSGIQAGSEATFFLTFLSETLTFK